MREVEKFKWLVLTIKLIFLIRGNRDCGLQFCYWSNFFVVLQSRSKTWYVKKGRVTKLLVNWLCCDLILEIKQSLIALGWIVFACGQSDGRTLFFNAKLILYTKYCCLQTVISMTYHMYLFAWWPLNFIFLKVDSPTTEKKSEPEPSFEILTNPARVVPAQEKFIKFLQDSRYVPVKLAPSGFVLLKDLRPTEPEVLALTDTPSSTTSAAGGSATGLQSSSSAMAVDEEPQPPQPFEYTSWVWSWFIKFKYSSWCLWKLVLLRRVATRMDQLYCSVAHLKTSSGAWIFIFP